MRKLSLVFCLGFLITTISVQSQVEEDVAAAISDLSFLLKGFTAPGSESIVYQSSSGWYTNAKSQKLWDLKLSAQANVLFIPKGKKTFLIKNSDFQNLSIQGGQTSANMPTAAGGISSVTVEGSIGPVGFDFTTPSGIDENFAFHGQLQATLGLPHGTSLSLRAAPKTKIKSSYVEAYGFGITHNISQWIPSIKASSFNISALVAYSIFKANDNFSPLDLIIGNVSAVEMTGNTVITGLIASKEVRNFDFSLGLIFTNSNNEFLFTGEGDELLKVLNDTVADTTQAMSNFTLDLGVNYNLNNFSVNSILTIGDFNNLLLGLNYTFKLKKPALESQQNVAE